MDATTLAERWAEAMDRIKGILDEATQPRFQGVTPFEPLAIPSDGPHAAFWYEGDETLFETLGDAAVAERITIRVYWRFQEPGQIRASLEREIRAVNRYIKDAIRSDAFLNKGGSTRYTDKAEPQAAATGYLTIGDIRYRVLSIPVKLWVYEADDIAP